MDFNAVYHRANDNFCYPLDKERLIINIKTGYDVKYVNIVQGDPFKEGILGGGETWTGEILNIPFKKRLKNQIWWTTTLEPQFKRLKYYFELQTEDELWYYFEDGFVSQRQLNMEGRSRQCFVFPWMNPSDIPVVPQWVNDTVWYQIFPDRFYNADASINPSYVLPWRNKGKVSNEEFYGGDLQGIKEKLNYLQELGISGIYLTPINESPSSHKYDTTDYFKIDSHFGSEETFQSLVQEAHQRNIKVMLDGVFNHCGSKFEPWLDVVEKGPDSEYWEWFLIEEWPFDFSKGAARNKQYYSFAFCDQMPKLNTNNPKVRDYFIQVCETWIKKYDVDGIRLDVANELSHTFCKELRKELKKIKPDVYILGEIWHDAMPWLRGDEFDGVMNYPLAESIKDFWIDKSLSKEDFEFMINRCYTGYMQQTNDVLFNLLDSHDTKRLRSEVHSIDEFYQQLATLFIMPGSPCIFYGTEIAMEGGHDPDCRRCMPWEEIEQGIYDESIEILKQLICLRQQEPLLKSRNFHFPNFYENPRVIEISKLGWIDNAVDIIMNCSEEEISIEEEGEILFHRHFSEGILGKNGILIRKDIR
ncbi:glycoside hydrolase family 13 protein [Anaerosacchariphilus polymeriproducens]|uniref:Glycoside hydrolase family 13 protein n=1 Tax=Anaerosacchariphilus polymeriproducens TaxID=1812858 RepID=A0A371AS47_9FIRM|nr:glycoside hydrolase family 13 protein [Anaerosacchariphilus polymeriproducens]RDU22387.1 glycoside hydrolase family 13 protein [Anaerosacchariphilus polymeriproducens]